MNKNFLAIPIIVGLALSFSFILESTRTVENVIASSGSQSFVIIPKGSVNMENNLPFVPDEITVVIGVNNTVTWYNKDTVPIFIDSLHGNFTQVRIDPEDISSISFDEPGVYEYHGHPWMNGIIIVLDK
jgi:plastocyanin